MDNTEEKVNNLINSAVWWRFVCNYGESDWPDDPVKHISDYYKEGMEEVYNEDHSKRIILWFPYIIFSKEMLLEVIQDYRYDIESILSQYKKIINSEETK